MFAQRYGLAPDGGRFKHCYVPESVGIAVGVLIAAAHRAGLVWLEHTPNSMKFLNAACKWPAKEEPVMILPVGRLAAQATVPAVAKIKKPLPEVLSVL
ncbi:MAG: hypothetical protein K0B00_04130 [Rhodobacteraceae bacterium]|nr:hypothetical protein [Paracoccaceae bacterium]